ncbi:MAG: type II secretion system minor pseudopilin GspK, partial [Burkholderiaceae bacterium]
TGPLDHLGEPWAVPVEETRLDETVTAGARIDSDAQAATLSGSITDAQSRFNLNNLVTAAKSGQPPAVFPPAIEKFSKLLDLLGLSPSLADTLAARLLAAAPAGPDEQSGVGALGDAPVEVALPLIRVGDLITVRGFDAEAVQALEPFVTFLPEFTRINVNTAPAEVLASVIDDLDLGGARQQVTRRDRTPFKSVADFRLAMSPPPETLDEAWLGTGSKYFLVRGLIRFGRVESLSETLLSRTDTRRVNVIWQRRL